MKSVPNASPEDFVCAGCVIKSVTRATTPFGACRYMVIMYDLDVLVRVNLALAVNK